jgi:hypothetical protein
MDGDSWYSYFALFKTPTCQRTFHHCVASGCVRKPQVEHRAHDPRREVWLAEYRGKFSLGYGGKGRVGKGGMARFCEAVAAWDGVSPEYVRREVENVYRAEWRKRKKGEK